MVKLDHLAVGVRTWADGYPRFVSELGGEWSHGGNAGDFAPCQLVYGQDMRIELIAPSAPGGFMERFIEHNGPGPHHITFKVPSINHTLEQVGRLGIDIVGGRTEMPYWKEAFLHPKLCGVGTLLQVVQSDDAQMAEYLANSPAPADFPTSQPQPKSLSWIGLTTIDLEAARELFVGALEGEVIAQDTGWMQVSWAPGHSLLIRQEQAFPGGKDIWANSPSPGVAHLMVGDPALTPQSLERSGSQQALTWDSRTGLAVWDARGVQA